MGRWKLWFALLLVLCFSTDSEETSQLLVKTVGSKPDVTPICTNETLNIIILIVCKISTERNRGEECHLLHRHGQIVVQKCDSRFTLVTENQTVFLHLTRLTPDDSGNYTCECSHIEGTHILLLNITVEEDEAADASSSTEVPPVTVVIGVSVVLIISGIISGLILRKVLNRRRVEIPTSRPNTELQYIEPYLTFIQRENELYSRVQMCTTTYSNVLTQSGTDLRMPL